MELTIHLPKPHPKQRAFVRSKAKRIVVVAGRRVGKTTGVAIKAVEAMLKGRRVLEAAPVSDQTNAFWDACKKALAEPITAGIVKKNETDRTLEMPNGGRIKTKTAFNADTLRGDYCDLLILDEYSLMDPDAWNEVGAPMLLDNDGDAVFIFTPLRKNHAYHLFVRAQADDTGRWEAFQFTSFDNPHLSEDALQEITSDMTEDAYKQEILAMFLEGEGIVFRNIEACLNAPQTTPGAHDGHRLVAGVDWGKQHDYTCISIGCVTCRCEVVRDRFNQIDYTVQRDRLRALYEKWRPAYILAEANAMGDPIIDVLQRERLPVLPFQTTATTKPPLIENLALTFERGEWQFQPDPIWTAELEAYERKVSPTTGRSSYSAPEGIHDDTIICRSLMIWQAMQTGNVAVHQSHVRNRGGKGMIRRSTRRAA
jgi:ferredoxin